MMPVASAGRIMRARDTLGREEEAMRPPAAAWVAVAARRDAALAWRATTLVIAVADQVDGKAAVPRAVTADLLSP